LHRLWIRETVDEDDAGKGALFVDDELIEALFMGASAPGPRLAPPASASCMRIIDIRDCSHTQAPREGRRPENPLTAGAGR